MFSKSEGERKVRFDQLFRAQQSCGGIIEPKKLEVLVPGMFVSLPPSTRAPSCSESRGEATASSIIQASESSASLTDVVTEAEHLLLQDIDNLRLGTEQADAHTGLETGGATECMRKYNRQFNDNRRRKGGRQNYTGGKQWIRRDQEGCK